jgi:hypothetical protein
MNETIAVTCPYCSEILYIEPEPSSTAVEYVEDCHVCCQPIVMTVRFSEDGSQVTTRRESE